MAVISIFFCFFVTGTSLLLGQVFSDSTGFPHKGLVFHAFPRLFHEVFPQKAANARSFFYFCIQYVENTVEIVETDLFFHIFHAHPGSVSRNSDAKDLAVVLDLLAGGGGRSAWWP